MGFELESKLSEMKKGEWNVTYHKGSRGADTVLIRPTFGMVELAFLHDGKNGKGYNVHTVFTLNGQIFTCDERMSNLSIETISVSALIRLINNMVDDELVPNLVCALLYGFHESKKEDYKEYDFDYLKTLAYIEDADKSDYDFPSEVDGEKLEIGVIME